MCRLLYQIRVLFSQRTKVPGTRVAVHLSTDSPRNLQLSQRLLPQPTSCPLNFWLGIDMSSYVCLAWVIRRVECCRNISQLLCQGRELYLYATSSIIALTMDTNDL